MPSETVHSALVAAIFGFGVFTFAALMLVSAPYGRHLRKGWGPAMDNRLGWVLMESPAVLVFAFIFFMGDHATAWLSLCFLGFWQLHYLHRAFVYPFRTHTSGKKIPILIVAMAVGFNVLNAVVNGSWVGHFGNYPSDWLVDYRFLAGGGLFLLGWAVNMDSDTRLIHLRKAGDTGYAIPRGGGFRWVSCPNYTGELLAWLGWALATWSVAGLAFAFYSAANLVPRALSHHRWYRASFPDYPAERKAILPFLL